MILIGSRYILGGKIGSGTFGEVFHCSSKGINYAVKLEPLDAHPAQLKYEFKLYEHLHKRYAIPGIPRVYYYGREGDYNVLVMELLGPTIETLFARNNYSLPLPTVCLLADQLLHLVESVHSAGYLHRDLKPDNFAIGLGDKSNQIYLFDFGLAKRFKGVKYREDKQLTGTARYASTNAHLGIEQSRRDDLESLGFVFVYLLKGSLPWQGITNVSRKRKQQKITRLKLEISPETLTSGLPAEFAIYLRYCRSLGFDDKPDYSYVRSLFRNILKRIPENEHKLNL